MNASVLIFAGLAILLVQCATAAPPVSEEKAVPEEGLAAGSAAEDNDTSQIGAFFSRFYSRTDRYDLAAVVLRAFIEHTFGVFYSG